MIHLVIVLAFLKFRMVTSICLHGWSTFQEFRHLLCLHHALCYLHHFTLLTIRLISSPCLFVLLLVLPSRTFPGNCRVWLPARSSVSLSPMFVMPETKAIQSGKQYINCRGLCPRLQSKKRQYTLRPFSNFIRFVPTPRPVSVH